MLATAPLKRLLLRSSIVAGIAVGAVATSLAGSAGQPVGPVVEGQVGLDSGGITLDSTTTDANGSHDFVVRAGTYAIGFGKPASASFANQLASSTVEGKANVIAGISSNAVVAHGDSALDLDASLIIHDPDIQLEKATNGEDADAAPGPTLISGSTVTFTYVVTNTGNIALSDIDVTDDVLGDVCTIDDLAVGDSDQCEITSIVTPGRYTNLGTAEGVPVVNNVELNSVSDTDPSHHSGTVTPGIDIEKATNGVDADIAPGPELVTGSAVAFTYVVTNLGNVPLIDVVVTDDQIGAVCTIAALAIGASDQCELLSIVQPGPYASTGTVVGTPVVQGVPLQQIVDADPSHHTGTFHPAITIEKATNGEDADDAPGVLLDVGDGVTWTYVVGNVGNVTLADVVVTDDQLGQICTIGDLEVGATGQCTASGTAVEGQHTNVGSATGLPVFPGFSFLPVSDIDPSNYRGVVPPPACIPDIAGPLMWAGAIVDWDLGQQAAAGSLIRIITHEPDSSPGQPHEQVYVQVGDDIYGPTPLGLGELAFTVVDAGSVRVLHYSVVTGDVSNPNSVAFVFCGSDLF